MKIRWNLVLIGVVGAAVGFTLQGQGPLGKMLWPMAEGLPQPAGMDLAMLMAMGIIESIAFGVGAAFLVAAWPWVKARRGGSWSWPVYIAIAWALMSWVPHTAQHMSHGNITSSADFGGLVGIEYTFHFTLMVCGAILAGYALRSAVGPAPAAAPMRK